jgi:hypothetical protein
MTVRELEVTAPVVTVDSGTGSATIRCATNQEPIQLYLAADVLLFLQEQIAQRLAEARHGGLRILPVATGCHGLEIGGIPPRLRIRLVLEDGSEGRLPIQESALHRLNKLATDWFVDRQERDSQDQFDE